MSGCLAVPDGIEPVDNFELNRYLGDWYEIARLDHSFERGLEAVKAEYSLRDDGGIRVINSGRDSKSQVAQQAEGRAYFVEEPNLGHLKVSFFGPFFGSYVIFELDENYQYAFIAGNSRDYLWLLARTPEVSEELIDQFISRASLLGFDTSQLIFVTH
ncbi:MAG: lipocalin family protein [Porticoccaceae bacterium]